MISEERVGTKFEAFGNLKKRGSLNQTEKQLQNSKLLQKIHKGRATRRNLASFIQGCNTTSNGSKILKAA